MCGWSMNNGVGPTGSQATGTANAPAAGAVITTITLGNGTYNVEWTIELTGTPGAADVDNVQLLIGGAIVADSSNLGAVGDYPQEEATGTITFGSGTIQAKAIGAATVGSVYKVTFTITPLTQSTAVVRDGSQTLGFISLPPGGNQTVWLSDIGIECRTELSVQTSLGNVNGVLYYTLVYPADLEAGRGEY